MITKLRVAEAMHKASGGDAMVPFSDLLEVSPHWYKTLLVQADAAIAECSWEIERSLVKRFKNYAAPTGTKGPAWAEGMLKADKTIAIVRGIVGAVRRGANA